MTNARKTTGSRATSDEPRGTVRFVELVNWRAAQPTMPDQDAPWMKLYTSLLDNDAFTSLDDRARMLLVSLWLYAAKSGRHVFPADGEWLMRKIPILNAEPDLRPLMEAKDAYGEPRPFVRIVDKTGIYNVGNAIDRDRDRDREKPLRASEKESKKKKRNASPTGDAVVSEGQNQKQNQKKSKKKTQTQGQTQTPSPDAGQSENPQNPRKPEAGGPACANAPKAPPSLSKGTVEGYRDRLGKIPIWWSDPACVGFSYAVFEALALRCDPESDKGRSERGTFAAWLFHARARTQAVDWQWLEDKAIAKAREIARYGKSAHKPGAVWLSVMHKELTARAGPNAATG